MKRRLVKLAILMSLLILVVGCSSTGSTTKDKKGEGTTSVTPKDNGKGADTASQDTKSNEKTVRTYLEYEFTGPNDEFKKALDKFYKDEKPDPSLYDEYLEKYYKPMVTDNVYDQIINANLSAYYIRCAYSYGYQLKPTLIDIQKANSENTAFSFKVEVEYSKDGKTNKATVTGYINFNDKGKISAIRDIDDDDFVQKMMPPSPK
ncbi:MAG: hypothetical protein ACO1OT_09335 [Heyndrickxia sp.]